MPSLAAQVVNLHRAQLQGLIELGGVRKLRTAYEEVRAEMERRLARMVAAGEGQTFTAHHSRMVLSQVNDALIQFQQELGNQLPANASKAAVLAQRHVVDAIKRFERRFSGTAPILQVEQAAVFKRIYKGIEPSLLDRYHKLKVNYPLPTIRRIRNQMALSMLSNDTVDQAVSKVASADGLFARERWRAERIVRTETSYAYGISNQRVMGETAKEVPSLMKRLVATFDGRTGEDSKDLNGQTVPWDKPFVWMKETAGGGLERIEYMQPPNRPHDREISIPWRGDYHGIPEEPGAVKPQSPRL